MYDGYKDACVKAHAQPFFSECWLMPQNICIRLKSIQPNILVC